MIVRVRSRQLFVVIFAMMLAALGWVSLLGLSVQKWIEAHLHVGDLSLHFLGFAAATFAGTLVWKPPPKVAALMMLFAGAIEGVQLITPDRVGSLVDFGISTVGVVAGWLIGAIVQTVRFSSARAVRRKDRSRS